MRNRDLDATKKCIKDFLLGLRRTERLVVVLYYYEKVAMPEIAESLGLSAPEILQMLSSVVRRCKAHLRERGLL